MCTQHECNSTCINCNRPDLKTLAQLSTQHPTHSFQPTVGAVHSTCHPGRESNHHLILLHVTPDQCWPACYQAAITHNSAQPFFPPVCSETKLAIALSSTDNYTDGRITSQGSALGGALVTERATGLRRLIAQKINWTPPLVFIIHVHLWHSMQAKSGFQPSTLTGPI